MGKEKTTDLEFEARKEKKKLKEKRKIDEPGRNSASIEGSKDKITEAVQVEKFDKNGESGEGFKKKKKRKREMEGVDGGLKAKQNDVQQLRNNKEKSNEFDKNVGTDKESGEGNGGTDRESGEGAKKKKKRKKETEGVNSELESNHSDEQLLRNDREKFNEFDKNVGTDKENGEGNGGTDGESGEGAKKKKKRKKETEGVNSELKSSDEQLRGNDREKSNGKIMEEADIAYNEKKRKKLSEDDEMDDAKMNKGEVNKKKKKKKKEKTEKVGSESVQNTVTDGKEAGVESKHSDGQVMEKGGIMKKEKTKNSKNSRSEMQETGGEKLGSKSSRTQENNSLENDGNVHGTGDEISNRNTEDKNSTHKETSKRVHFADDIEVFSLSDGSKDSEVGKVRGKRFSAEEDELVKKAVLTYIEEHQLGDEGIDMVLNCKNYPEIRNCWKDIGETLPWRDKKSIYYRAHMLLERASERTWSKEEYEKVRRAANEAKEKGEAKPNWRKVGNELGKHRIHVKDAWRRIKLQNMKTGVWSQEEYQTLFDLVNKDLRMRALEEKKYSKHGMLRDNIKWEAISETLGTRTNPVCCQKWYNQLASPLVADGQWADVDDYRLVYALDSLDACCMEEVDWDDLLEHRSGDVCKKRWNQMVRHIGQYAMKSFAEQVEILSKRYCPDALEAKEAFDSKPIVDQVYMAREIKTGEIVALKKIRMDNEREGFPITAIREIKILKKLHHDNVINLKEIVTSPGPEKDEQGRPDGNKYKGGIYMVFEYMDHDLTGLADRPGMRFSVAQIKCYMKQLLTGLHYCHVNQVLHRDIKGSNLLIDNEGNLKLADFGLARSFSNGHNANLTNRVITLWYRPPELLLGATKYGPAVDMWSVGCIFAELLHGKPIFPGKDEPEQLNKIFELCGAPDEVNWPGVSKIPWYNNFKPTRPLKKRLRDVFRHFDRHALELLEKMLTLDPSQRISAKDALDAEYFWTDPLPCDPKSLPKYESSHEFQTKKKRQQQRQHEENAKRQKLQHPQQHTRLPPIQQSGQAHSQMRPGPNQPIHGSQPPVATGPSHHYGKPRGPSGGASRYPPGGNPGGGYNHPSRGAQGGGGGYSSGPYPPAQGRGAPYGSSGMPGAGPRGGGSGYGVGAPNYPQNGPYGGSAAGRGSNMMGGNRNQQYGWQQ